MLTLEQVRAKSAKRIVSLSDVQRKAAELLIDFAYACGVPIVITQGLRTIDEQNGLYAQGRAKPGQIVTNARGGYSYHNFGVAIDFALLLPDGKNVSWDMRRDGDGDGIAAGTRWSRRQNVSDGIGAVIGARLKTIRISR
ncbi:M15 family metallopeptidase [Paenibacillus terrae]|uniref:M15 family metallopeptidase n=1 Tax=Paenibacillus terrae TaxID=159743 RepID=UPI000A64C368